MAENIERKVLFKWVEDRFGIPETIFDDYLLFERKKRGFLLQKSPHLNSAGYLKVSKIGIRAFQKVGHFVKPTTRFVQAFGHLATKAVFDINLEQLRKLVFEREIAVDLKIEKGYVILRLDKNQILGLGFFIEGSVRTQLPKKELRLAMLDNMAH